MKKFLPILLLVTFLSSVVNFRELIKVKMLVSHFQETCKQDPSISFFQFLVMHYITDDLNGQDNEQDMQLPFKSQGSCSDINLITDIVISCNSNPVLPNEICINTLLVPDIIFITMNCQYIIWHPPQVS